MPIILNIETATGICSVALAKDGELISIAETDEPRAHAGMTAPMIQQVMNESGLKFQQLDAVAVSKGPGSYTGLRIGVATAKGLCYALNKPLIAINSLQAMAGKFISDSKPEFSASLQESKLIPLIDARRMEVYSAVFDEGLNFLCETKAEIVNEKSFSEWMNQQVFFFGDGAEKCSAFLIKNSSATLIENFRASAKGMIRLSEAAFHKKEFEDIACFEPFYLKDFVAMR